MKIRFVLIIGVALAINSVRAQEALNLMFYNLLQFPSLGNPDRIDHLEAIIDATRPDLFMVCELNNQEGANLIELRLQNTLPSYVAAPFWTNSSDDNSNDLNNLQNLIFYDTNKFILDDQDVVVTYLRDFNHYVLKLNTVNQATNPLMLHVFVGHLKASSGSTNEQLRLDMAQDFTTYIDSLDSNSYVILAGDFNLYDDDEPAYQEFLNASNNIPLIDPANRPGDWHNNVAYLDVFSQSTHALSGDGFASGGFDDRFDFILCSGNLINGNEISYIENSYATVGNNNNPDCFNQSINAVDCEGELYGIALRDHLYHMSDHLPITMQLAVNDNFLNTSAYNLNHKDFELAYSHITDSLEISVNSRIFGDKNYLLIYDIMGRLIYETRIGYNSKFFIPSAHMPEGQYLIKSSVSTAPAQKFFKH